MKKNGFTLVELMIIIVIIGILVAIAYPNYQMMRTQDKEHKVRAQMEGLVPDLDAFHLANSHYPSSLQEKLDFQDTYLAALENPLGSPGHPVLLTTPAWAHPEYLVPGQVLIVLKENAYTIHGMGPNGLLEPISGGLHDDELRISETQTE